MKYREWKYNVPKHRALWKQIVDSAVPIESGSDEKVEKVDEAVVGNGPLRMRKVAS